MVKKDEGRKMERKESPKSQERDGSCCLDSFLPSLKAKRQQLEPFRYIAILRGTKEVWICVDGEYVCEMKYGLLVQGVLMAWCALLACPVIILRPGEWRNCVTPFTHLLSPTATFSINLLLHSRLQEVNRHSGGHEGDDAVSLPQQRTCCTVSIVLVYLHMCKWKMHRGSEPVLSNYWSDLSQIGSL